MILLMAVHDLIIIPALFMNISSMSDFNYINNHNIFLDIKNYPVFSNPQSKKIAANYFFHMGVRSNSNPP